MSGRRADGTNPRAAGTNPRAIGTNPKGLVEAERAAWSAAVAAAIAKRPADVPPPICDLVERALLDDEWHEVWHSDTDVLVTFREYVFSCCKTQGLLCNVRFRYKAADETTKGQWLMFSVGLRRHPTVSETLPEVPHPGPVNQQMDMNTQNRKAS